jgi:hypothetical protein
VWYVNEWLNGCNKRSNAYKKAYGNSLWSHDQCNTVSVTAVVSSRKKKGDGVAKRRRCWCNAHPMNFTLIFWVCWGPRYAIGHVDTYYSADCYSYCCWTCSYATLGNVQYHMATRSHALFGSTASEASAGLFHSRSPPFDKSRLMHLYISIYLYDWLSNSYNVQAIALLR